MYLFLFVRAGSVFLLRLLSSYGGRGSPGTIFCILVIPCSSQGPQHIITQLFNADRDGLVVILVQLIS